MSLKTKIVSDWWWTALGNRDTANARARAARLKRADGVSVLCDPEVHVLARNLDINIYNAESLIRMVQTLAHVRERGKSLPSAMGGSDPKLSSLRFERLIRCSETEIGSAVRRALPLVTYTCDPGQLGMDLLYWNDQTRTRWTFNYYGATAPMADKDSVIETKEGQAP